MAGLSWRISVGNFAAEIEPSLLAGATSGDGTSRGFYHYAKMEGYQMRAGMVISAVIWGLVYLSAAGCTLKIDNPFYSPTSIDVNKTESKAVNNYTKK